MSQETLSSFCFPDDSHFFIKWQHTPTQSPSPPCMVFCLSFTVNSGQLRNLPQMPFLPFFNMPFFLDLIWPEKEKEKKWHFFHDEKAETNSWAFSLLAVMTSSQVLDAQISVPRCRTVEVVHQTFHSDPSTFTPSSSQFTANCYISLNLPTVSFKF